MQPYVSCEDPHTITSQYITNNYSYSFPLTGTDYDIGGYNLKNVGTIEATTYSAGTVITYKDKDIVLNSDKASLAGTTAGLLIYRASPLTNYEISFDEDTDSIKVGATGSTQAILTRPDSSAMHSNGLISWDATNLYGCTISGNTLDSSGNLTIGGNFTRGITEFHTTLQLGSTTGGGVWNDK
jgi:hypothetical protein